MEPFDPEADSRAQAKIIAHRQCPKCGFNNPYSYTRGEQWREDKTWQEAQPQQCSRCLYQFPHPLEAEQEFFRLLAQSPWRRLVLKVERAFAGHRVRLVLLGVALGTALGEIGRRLWL